MSITPQELRNCAKILERSGFAGSIECERAADEIERLEKERFKYETALMLIGEGIQPAASLAKAAIGRL